MKQVHVPFSDEKRSQLPQASKVQRGRREQEFGASTEVWYDRLAQRWHTADLLLLTRCIYPQSNRTATSRCLLLSFRIQPKPPHRVLSTDTGEAASSARKCTTRGQGKQKSFWNQTRKLGKPRVTWATFTYEQRTNFHILNTQTYLITRGTSPHGID